MQKCQLGNQQIFQKDIENRVKQISPTKQFRYKKQKAVKKQVSKLSDIYSIKQKIGSGSFGEVHKIQHKQLKLIRALKIVNKVEKSSNHNPEDELNILKQLDHPNVLKIYQYFQTEREWQIVTQYFQGKELFDQIISDKGISQSKAAKIFAQICKALAYIHGHSIVHRDIKPQNIMIKQSGQNQFNVKLIDWGLGSKVVKDLLRKCGTPQYCAPEIIKGSYGYQCDLWSLGVVLYVMLAGRFPFKGGNVKETLILVSKGIFNFDGPQWTKISQDAKLLISKLLKKDPKQRLTASECLKQPWVVNNIGDTKYETKLTETLQRLKQVNYENKFQAIVINFIHNYLINSEQELKLKKQFQELDQNKDGVLSLEQLKNGYIKIYGAQQAQKIVDQIFNRIDLDKSNSIQYSQFLGFGMKITSQFSKQQLRQAFRYFDEQQKGKINKKELSRFLSYERTTQSQDFDDLIGEIDNDKDGFIDFDQFVENIRKMIQKALSNSQSQTQYFSSNLALKILQTEKLKKKSISTFTNETDKQYKI